MAPLQELAERWLACFNAKDLDGLLRLYADDAVHLSPKLKVKKPETAGFVRGQSALRAWWSEAFSQLPTLHYEKKAITAGADRVLLEYTRVLNGEAPIGVAEVFEVGAAGKITSSRVYHGVPLGDEGAS